MIIGCILQCPRWVVERQYLLTNVRQRIPDFASGIDDIQRSAEIMCRLGVWWLRRTAQLIYSVWTARYWCYNCMTVHADSIYGVSMYSYNSASLGLLPSAFVFAHVHFNIDINIMYCFNFRGNYYTNVYITMHVYICTQWSWSLAANVATKTIEPSSAC